MSLSRRTIIQLALLLASPVALAQEGAVPAGYPDSYKEVIEKSKSEGKLLIYSNMSPKNWEPILSGFRKKYPWITAETLDLSSGTIHTRWKAESQTKARTGDVIVSAAIEHWVQHGVNGDMLAYDSPELKDLPPFAREYDSVFVLSTDPFIMTYNAALLPENMRPTGLKSLVDLAEANPGVFKGKVTIMEPRNSTGQAIWWNLMKTQGDAGWANVEKLAPVVRVEQTGGTMNEKVATGEYVVSFGVSGITIFPRLSQPGGELLTVAFPDDGTLMMFRAIGIPKQSANVNSAKLLVDYALSKEGQTLLGKGGLTPYRADVAAADVPYYTYQSIEEKVGKENMINVTFTPDLVKEAAEFQARMDAALKR